MLPKSTETVGAIEGVSYRVLEGNIHELALNMPKFNQKALNEYYGTLKRLFATAPNGRFLYILTLLSGKMAPLGQSIQFARDVMNQYPDRPMTHVAIVMAPDPLVQLGDTMLRMMRLDTRGNAFRIFKPDQQAEALAWLLAAKAAAPSDVSV